MKLFRTVTLQNTYGRLPLSNLGDTYLFKVNSENTRTICEIYLKVTITASSMTSI